MQNRGLMRDPGETNGSCKPRTRTSLWEGAGESADTGRAGQSRGSANLSEEAQREGETQRGRGHPGLQVREPGARSARKRGPEKAA